MSTPAPASSGPHPIRFGDFELDARSGELRNNGTRVVLAEQPLQVLLALIERPGEIVTRDELRQRLWPGDTFVDFEHGLNAAVKRLRDALGDSAETPRYVETVPRRGYRLIADVDDDASIRTAPQPANDQPPPPGPAPTPDRQKRWPMAVVGTLALAAIVIAVFTWRRSGGVDTTPPPPATRTLTRLTFGPGLQTDVTWSPDGQRIAYASDRSGNFDIWAQPVAGGDPIQLTASPDADTQPSWSPDGSSIAFRSEREGGGVFAVPAVGGAARRLTTFGMHPAWMPGGQDILVQHGLEGTYLRAYLVSAGGGEPPREIVQEFLRDGNWEWMAPHPDGRISTIGFHRTQGFGFYTVSPDGRDSTIVRPPASLLTSLTGEEPHPERRFRWSPLGNALFVEAAANQIRSLWRVPVAPATLQWLSAERLTTGADNAKLPAISPDGTRIAYSSEQMSSRAFIFSFDPVRGRLEGDGRPVTDDDTRALGASLSRDGRSLLYGAQRTGSENVDAVRLNLETGETSLLARGGRGPLESPDGERYVYLLMRRATHDGGAAANANPFEFALALRDPGGSERLVSRWSNRAVMMVSDWVPNGHAVLGPYFVESAGTGPVALALWPITGPIPDKPERVLLQDPARQFWQPMFSPDGRWISFVASSTDRPDTLEMGVIPSGGASADAWTRIAADHDWPDKPRWAPDGRTLYFISRKPAGYFNLWGVRMDPGRGTPVGEPFQITSFASPDLVIDPNIVASEMDIRGRRLLLMMRKTTGNIWMLSGVDR